MGMVLTEEQGLLLDSARNFVEGRSPLSAFRALRDRGEEAGFDPKLWSEMVQMGWAGLPIPEAYGGYGFDFQGLCLILEELGKTLTHSPLISTVVLGATAVMEGGTDDQKADLLPKIAAGECLLALANDEGPHHNPALVETRATPVAGGYSLSGTKTMVVDAWTAHKLIVAARTSGQKGERYGITLFLVDKAAQGLRMGRSTMIDHRNAAEVVFESVTVGADAVLGSVDGGFAILEKALDKGRIALASEMLGSAQNAFDITLDYLKQRTQFGQTIGQFQALQHRAAMMFSELELLRSVVMESASAVDENPAQVPLLASLAKARANDVLHLVAREAIQMHGGIGMTDAHDIGFFLKRSAVAEYLLGGSKFHRDRYAALAGF